MPELPLYQIDAFIRPGVSGFSGNPAAVVPLTQWLSDTQMQAIAAENNLSETAFYVRQADGRYYIRWFTPTTEVDLCGHATLAAAHVIRADQPYENEWLFDCQAGELCVRAHGADLQLDFPARSARILQNDTLQRQLEQWLGVPVVAMAQARDLIVELESADAVRTCEPDFSALAELDVFAIAITARCDAPDYDFVSRFFAPRQGIGEDPVTGSSFCSLAPYWTERLQKTTLRAWQCSARGGDIGLVLHNGRVLISGRTFAYLSGHIHLP